MKAVADTRFLVTHFLGPDERTRKWTSKTLTELQNRANIGFVPSIAILEFYKFIFENKGKDAADTRINYILTSKLHVVNLDSVIGIEAAKLRCKYSEMPTADAIISATAIVTGSDFVLTDYRHINQVKEIKTKWL